MPDERIADFAVQPIAIRAIGQDDETVAGFKIALDPCVVTVVGTAVMEDPRRAGAIHSRPKAMRAR